MFPSKSAFISFLFVLIAGSVQPSLTAQADVHDRLKQAERLLSEQKFQAAREILEGLVVSAVEKAPPQAYYQLSLCYAKQAEWKKAEQAIQEFLKLSPEDFSALYLKGFVLFSSGRYQESLKVMEPLAERNPVARCDAESDWAQSIHAESSRSG